MIKFDLKINLSNPEVWYCCMIFSKKYENVDETLPEPSAPRTAPIDRVSYHSGVRTPNADAYLGKYLSL